MHYVFSIDTFLIAFNLHAMQLRASLDISVEPYSGQILALAMSRSELRSFIKTPQYRNERKSDANEKTPELQPWLNTDRKK